MAPYRTLDDIIKPYKEVMSAITTKTTPDTSHQPQTLDPWVPPEEAYGLALLILEMAKAATIPRGYFTRHGKPVESIVAESTAGHTAIVSLLVELALTYFRERGEKTSQFHPTIVTLVALLHDLAENRFGDLPDNGSRDEAAKRENEESFLSEHLQHLRDTPTGETFFSVMELFSQMGDRPHQTINKEATLLNLADKAASVIIVWWLSTTPWRLHISIEDPSLSQKDAEEISLIQKYGYCHDGGCGPEHMWLCDWLVERKLYVYDHGLFFTSVIVMSVLILAEWPKWYNIPPD